MENLRVLLCCGAGISSGFLASNARKYVKKAGCQVSIEARSHSEAAEFIPNVDVMLLGPHYASSLETFANIAKPYGTKVAVIPEAIYGTLDGKALVEFAQNL